MAEVSGENFQKQLEITKNIDWLLWNIENETGGFSTHNHKFEHEDFKTLVKMGDRIIPYIFHKMVHHGASWTYFLLLQQITQYNPVPKKHFGKLRWHLIYWLWWFEASKYSKYDVYFNLVD